MASDLDAVEKLFCGKWKYDRDENFKECLQKIKFPDGEVEYIANAKPVMVVERRGDEIFIDYEMAPGVKHDITFKLGEMFISKDKKNDPPTFNSKELVEFKDGSLVFKNWSQMEGPSKVNYQTTMTIKGNELHGVMGPIDDTSNTGNRIYKKV